MLISSHSDIKCNFAEKNQNVRIDTFLIFAHIFSLWTKQFFLYIYFCRKEYLLQIECTHVCSLVWRLWLICIEVKRRFFIIAFLRLRPIYSISNSSHLLLLSKRRGAWRRKQVRKNIMTQDFFVHLFFKNHSIQWNCVSFFRWKEINVAYHNIHELVQEKVEEKEEEKNKALKSTFYDPRF